MPQLTDLSVEEVSLVDRPATGRRFRIFKRAAPARLLERLRGGGEGNICSNTTETAADEPEGDPARLQKRVSETLDAVLDSLGELADRVDAIQKRLDDAVSEPSAAPMTERQSLDPATGRKSLWKGVF